MEIIEATNMQEESKNENAAENSHHKAGIMKKISHFIDKNKWLQITLVILFFLFVFFIIALLNNFYIIPIKDWI